MPKSEMIKLIAKYGIMLSCGWLPPSMATAALFMVASATAGKAYGFIAVSALEAHLVPVGLAEFPATA